MADVKVQDLSTHTPEQFQHYVDPSLIKLLISYPKSYEGTKYFPQDSIQWVSRESADILIGKGIATEQDRTKEETGTAEPVAEGVQDTSTVQMESESGTVSTVGHSKTSKTKKA